MKLIKEEVEIRYAYEAIDGKRFTYESDCLLYEKYLAIKDEVWSDFIFFHQDYDTKEFTIVEKPDYFDYAIVVNDTYEEYRKFLPEDFSQLKHKGALYHRDYSNAFNGGYGWNGWNYVCNRWEFENLLKFHEKFDFDGKERAR